MGAMHSSRLDYAIRALLELTKRDHVNKQRPTRIQEIASAQGIPARFLEAILVDLRRAGLVESRRGVKGGYWLTRRPETITVAELVHLVDGGITLVPSDASAGKSAAIASPAVRRLWARAAAALEQVYGATSFAELHEEDRAWSRDVADYSI